MLVMCLHGGVCWCVCVLVVCVGGGVCAHVGVLVPNVYLNSNKFYYSTTGHMIYGKSFINANINNRKKSRCVGLTLKSRSFHCRAYLPHIFFFQGLTCEFQYVSSCPHKHKEKLRELIPSDPTSNGEKPSSNY